jgi:hypothetical protein
MCHRPSVARKLAQCRHGLLIRHQPAWAVRLRISGCRASTGVREVCRGNGCDSDGKQSESSPCPRRQCLQNSLDKRSGLGARLTASGDKPVRCISGTADRCLSEKYVICRVIPSGSLSPLSLPFHSKSIKTRMGILQSPVSRYRFPCGDFGACIYGVYRGQIGVVWGRRAVGAEAPGGGKGSLRANQRVIKH